eukprot:9016533-Alexandrium_andersonii.AAC.1
MDLPDAVSLVASAHRGALLRLSAATNTHHRGLHQGARAICGMSSRACRRLRGRDHGRHPAAHHPSERCD